MLRPVPPPADETPLDDGPKIPTRELRDPKVLRALAHPVRIRILEELSLGPLTATEVAERVGESPANCSWHLRQLAKYDFVEEAGGGAGRRRPWQIIMRAHAWGTGEDDAELAVASDALTQVFLDRQNEVLHAWLATRRSEPAVWRDAELVLQGGKWLTAQELTELGEAFKELLMRHVDRMIDPAVRPPGARLIRFLAWGVPAVGVPPTPEPS